MKARSIATAGVLLGLVLSAFEGTVVTSAMPAIAARLGGIGSYSWVFTAFLLASTVGVLASGRLADTYGRKPIYVGGMALFLGGSALCGAAPTMGALIAFRAIQGLGAGALQPIAMTISADLYTLRERARVQALFNAAWGGANVVGPVLGGLIVEHASWRWVFFVNVPPGLLSAVLLALSFRDPPRARARSRPALALATFEPRVVRAGLVGGLFAGGLLYSCATYVPLWMTREAGHGAILAGAALVPMLVGWACGSAFGVRVLLRWGMRASTAGGCALAAFGASLFAASAIAHLPLAVSLATLALLGLGTGPAASTSLIAPQSAVAWSERGVVTSAIYAARMLGGGLAVTVLSRVPMSDDAPAARFVGVAAIATAAFFSMFTLAPHRVAEAARVASA